MAKKLMFDSNVFDDIITGKLDLDFLNEKEFEIHLTHIQVEELNNCPDVDKRARLFMFLVKSKPVTISTETFILGKSRFGFANLGDGRIYEILKSGNEKNINDALIGETAIKNNLILVTNDTTFRKKVEILGGKVLDITELMNL